VSHNRIISAPFLVTEKILLSVFLLGLEIFKEHTFWHEKFIPGKFFWLLTRGAPGFISAKSFNSTFQCNIDKYKHMTISRTHDTVMQNKDQYGNSYYQNNCADCWNYCCTPESVG
jgi:hypothetical protein